jgi:hypothetical protein
MLMVVIASPRRTPPLRFRHTAALAVLLVALSSCSFPGDHAAPSAIGTLLPRPPERIATPACGAVLGPLTRGFDPTMPRNITTILGFAPLLPASVPAPLTWNIAVIADISSSAGPTPLFHAAYGIWIERAMSTYALHTTAALDEVASAFNPTTNLTANGGTLRVADQQVISVNGAPAILYTLETSALGGSTGTRTRIDALMWHAQGLTLRLTAVETGSYTLFPVGPNENSDQVDAWAWPGGSDSALLTQFAGHVTRYTGCDAA